MQNTSSDWSYLGTLIICSEAFSCFLFRNKYCTDGVWVHAAVQHFSVDVQILLRVVVRCAGGPSGIDCPDMSWTELTFRAACFCLTTHDNRLHYLVSNHGACFSDIGAWPHHRPPPGLDGQWRQCPHQPSSLPPALRAWYSPFGMISLELWRLRW